VEEEVVFGESLIIQIRNSLKRIVIALLLEIELWNPYHSKSSISLLTGIAVFLKKCSASTQDFIE